MYFIAENYQELWQITALQGFSWIKRCWTGAEMMHNGIAIFHKEGVYWGVSQGFFSISFYPRAAYFSSFWKEKQKFHYSAFGYQLQALLLRAFC